MVEIVKFITITTVSVCVVNLIKKLDEDFNNMSYIYGLIMGGIICVLYSI